MKEIGQEIDVWEVSSVSKYKRTFQEGERGLSLMHPLVFLLHGQFVKKKFPRTPYETCKQGRRRIALLEYDNRSPKNCLQQGEGGSRIVRKSAQP
jgi:hypothetical protein